MRVRRSSRARRIRAVHRPGETPELVVPLRASERAVARALAQHREWFARQVAATPPPVLGLERVAITPEEGRVAALERLVPIVEGEAAELGVSFRRVVVRDQRSRWGSCSTTGTLSFNWRLVLGPPGVLDYVAVHEVCHLREPNHSSRFWRLVESVRPGYRAQLEWLERHGWELLTYRPVGSEA